ncbi:C4-dicarboxylic acid transporter DauA [Thalassotalea piscium]
MFSALKKSLASKSTFSDIQTNILAGLTVGVIALPLSMALAIASGVPPQHGLYTAIVAGIVIAICGGSKVNISGPTAAFVVVLIPIVQQYGIGGLLISGFMAGIVLVLMGVCKLGKFIEVVPYPVVIGFTSGIGVVIGTFQLKDFFGLSIESLDGDYLEKLLSIINALPTINLQEFLIGGLTITTLLIWPRFRSKIPGHLIALLIGSVAAWLLTHFSQDFSVVTIGSRFHYEIDGVIGNGIPAILPNFEWPWNLAGPDGSPIGLSFDLIKLLLPSAITIAILGSLESLLCATVADGMTGKKHNSNDELIGQGIGNMLVPLFGGIPATAAIARTAASIKAGSTMPLASVVHGLFILGSILALTPLLAYIPMASMAALLLVVAWNMSEVKHFVRTIRIAPQDDIIVLVLCFLLTVLFDMTIAVAVGMGLAAILFIRKSITLTNTTRIEKDYPSYGELPSSIAIYDINGPLFFGSAQKALQIISRVTPDVRVVILDMSEVNMLDMSAIVAMESIKESLSLNNIYLIINNLEERMVVKLNRAGIVNEAFKIQFSTNLEDSLALAYKEAEQQA